MAAAHGSGKSVLVLSGSPRKGGNSDILCDRFVQGAEEAGNRVEKIRVAEMNVGFCRACYACKGTGTCIVKDDMEGILQKMIDADVIVLASPVYFYSVDAQLKAVIDRTVARWLEVRDKEFYYIATCAEGEEEAARTTLECFRGYAACVKGAVEKGTVLGTGVYEKGEIVGTAAYDQAYRMGLGVRSRDAPGRRPAGRPAQEPSGSVMYLRQKGISSPPMPFPMMMRTMNTSASRENTPAEQK